MEQFLKEAADFPIGDTYIVMQVTSHALGVGTNIASWDFIRPHSGHRSATITAPVPVMTIESDFDLRQDNIFLDVVIETPAGR